MRRALATDQIRARGGQACGAVQISDRDWRKSARKCLIRVGRRAWRERWGSPDATTRSLSALPPTCCERPRWNAANIGEPADWPWKMIGWSLHRRGRGSAGMSHRQRPGIKFWHQAQVLSGPPCRSREDPPGILRFPGAQLRRLVSASNDRRYCGEPSPGRLGSWMPLAWDHKCRETGFVVKPGGAVLGRPQEACDTLCEHEQSEKPVPRMKLAHFPSSVGTVETRSELARLHCERYLVAVDQTKFPEKAVDWSTEGTLVGRPSVVAQTRTAVKPSPFSPGRVTAGVRGKRSGLNRHEGMRRTRQK